MAKIDPHSGNNNENAQDLFDLHYVLILMVGMHI